MLYRLFAVVAVGVLTTLISIPSNAVTWTCYDWNGDNWQMELPDDYMPTWSDCEAWRYGNPSPSPTYSPTPEPTPTEEPSPTPSETETSSPVPTPTSSPTDAVESPQPSSPSPSPTDTPYPTSYPEVPEPPVQEQDEPAPVVSPTFSEPEPSPLPDVQDTLEEVVDSSPSVSPSYEPSSLDEPLVQPLLDEESVSFLGVDIELPPLLSEAVQQVFEAINNSLESISNLGADLSPEERKEAQQVVLAAIIVPQLASSIVRRIK